MGLRCPVCGEELANRPQSSCATCETPAHSECVEYVGACPRFACKEAETPRRRVNEYLALGLDRSYYWSRARAAALLAWTAGNLAVGLAMLLINGWVVGFYMLPYSALWITGIRLTTHPTTGWAITIFGTVLPAAAGLFSLNQMLRTGEQRRWLSGSALTRRQQLELLRSFGPGPSHPELARALGPVCRVLAVACALASARMLARYVALMGTTSPLLRVGLLAADAGGFALAAGGLWLMGSSLSRSQHSDRQATKLAAMWQAELELLPADEAQEVSPRPPESPIHPAVKRLVLGVASVVLLTALSWPLGFGRPLRIRLARFLGYDAREKIFLRLEAQHDVADAWVVTPVLARDAVLDGLDRRLLSTQLALGLRLAGKPVLEVDLTAKFLENVACFKSGATPTVVELESMAHTKRAAHVLVPVVTGRTVSLMRHDFTADADLIGSQEIVNAPLGGFVRDALEKLGAVLPRYENLGTAFSVAPPRSFLLMEAIQTRTLATADDWARQGLDLAILGHHVMVERKISGRPLIEKGLAMTALARMAAPSASDVTLAHALALILAGRYARAVPLLEPLEPTATVATALLAVARPGTGLPDPATSGYLYRLAVERDPSFVFGGQAQLDLALQSSNADMVMAGLLKDMNAAAREQWAARWALDELDADARVPGAVEAAVEARARTLGVKPAGPFVLRHGVLETRVAAHLLPILRQELVWLPAIAVLRDAGFFRLSQILPLANNGWSYESPNAWKRSEEHQAHQQ